MSEPQETAETAETPNWAQVLTAHGIAYRDHVQREQRQNGVAKKVWLYTERPMQPEDILATREDARGMVLVTADGQKWLVRDGADPVNLLEV